MLKISTRITLWYMGSTGIVIILMGVIMYFIYKNQLRNSLDLELEDYANFLQSGLNLQSSDISEIYDELLKKKDEPQYKPRSHKFVLVSNDSVVFERNAIANIDSLLDDLVERNEFSYKSKFNTVKMNNVDFRTYSLPIKDKSGQTLQLLLFTSLDRQKDALATLRNILFLITPLSLIAAGSIGYLIAKRSLAPVHEITSTAAGISSKNLDKRVPVSRTKDELAELAETFNAMINRLDITFRSQRRFIADASHDIRTPVTIIMMELESLMQRDYIHPQTRETVTRSLSELQRLNRLIDSLLILARADSDMLSLNKQPFRLDEMVFDSLSGLNSLAVSKNVRFNFEVNEPIEVNADEDMLKRVVVNVLDNAIKYSPENETINIIIKKENSGVDLSISNKGLPIPKEMIETIFDRFKRGEQSRTSDGFGLGLSIVKAIVKAHNGDVTLYSERDSGTTLKIFLAN